tara:strand:+ start:1462 stop:2628 length:1167 start_codon:yes stop_codon:yes gene_type:complete
VAKRNIERTSNIILKNDVKLTGANVQMFGKLFDNWQQQLSGISGNTLFMENDISLYQMFKQQGLTGRLQGDKSPSPDTSGKGGSEIIGIITNIVDGEDIGIDDIIKLNKVRLLMDSYSKPKNPLNPRNISFTDKEIDEDSGKVADEEEVYGHYRTKNYENKRKIKMKKFPKRDLKPAPACPESWYNYSKDVAEPPFWQVMYGRGGDVKITSSKSLHEIIEEGIEALKDGVGISPENPIKLGKKGQTGWAEKALEINSIKRIVRKYIEPDMAGRNGAFRYSEVMRLIESKSHLLPTRKDFQNRVRNNLGIPEFFTLKRGYFKLTRGVANQMAKILLKENNRKFTEPKTGRKHNTVTIRFDKPEVKSQTKKTNDVEVSDWRDILKRELIC